MDFNELIVIYKGLTWHWITQSGPIAPPSSVKVMNTFHQPQEIIQAVVCGAHSL